MPQCPLCHNQEWTATAGIAVIQGSERADTTVVVDQGLPAIPLVCKRCGNTLFLNIFVLGVQDLFVGKGA